MTYNVFGGTLNLTQPTNLFIKSFLQYLSLLIMQYNKQATTELLWSHSHNHKCYVTLAFVLSDASCIHNSNNTTTYIT